MSKICEITKKELWLGIMCPMPRTVLDAHLSLIFTLTDYGLRNKFIKLTLSNKGLRIVNKLGLDAALTKYGLDQ